MASFGTNDDPSVLKTVVVGIIGAIIMFVLIVAVQALFYKEESDVARLYERDPGEARLRLAEQQEALNAYRYVDEKAGVVAIPIERAMELVVNELAAEQPASTGRSDGDK